MSGQEYENLLGKLVKGAKMPWRQVSYDVGEIRHGEKNGFETASTFLEQGIYCAQIHLFPDEANEAFAGFRLELSLTEDPTRYALEKLRSHFQKTISFLDKTQLLKAHDLEQNEDPIAPKVDIYYSGKIATRAQAEQFITLFLATVEKDFAPTATSA